MSSPHDRLIAHELDATDVETTTTTTEERIEITDCGSDICEWLYLHGRMVTTTAIAAGGSLAAHPGRTMVRTVTTTPWTPKQGELFT